MQTANIFLNGRSQAIRLPKEFRFSEKIVNISKIGEVVIITPQKAKWSTFLESLNEFSDDFANDRNQPSIQKRKKL